MTDKVSALISKVTVNSPVFSGEAFSPTLINYFFGKNGTGKSTIAKLIGKTDSTEWTMGVAPEDYELLVYNEEYIQDNIQNYGNIPGVFTITKQNASVKAAVDKKSAEVRAKSERKLEIDRELIKLDNDSDKQFGSLMDKVWKKTEAIRKAKYPSTQAGFASNRQKFVAELMRHTPTLIDEETLDALYAVAYGREDKRYKELVLVSATSVPSSALLERSIVSSSHTAFADFLKALNATAWVSQGHRDYQHAAGKKCPYCQRDLPATFEDDLASCFDEQYKQETNELKKFIQTYKTALEGIFVVLADNSKSEFPCDQLADYATKSNLFIEKVKSNITLLEKKGNDPSITVELTDLTDILQDLNDLAEQINQKIWQNNAILDDKSAKQDECKAMVWSLMATRCQTEIAVYQTEKAQIESEISRLTDEKEKVESSIVTLNEEIAQLNKQTVNTTAAKDSINALIKSSGFQGFHLREKQGIQYVYQLVREDGTIARGLSEGERHFIAFLYFYHTVMGSQSDEGRMKDKIVVIDDPVSSMDSSALFTVASLVREMIAVCYNNYQLTEEEGVDDHIKQIFCLTHNPFFFKEVVYNRISEYECVSIFEIKKQANNHSVIEKCEQDSPRVGDGKINRNPVVNTYEALWKEYRTSDDPVALMNVTRRILEYYFLQMCGYSNGNIRSDLLESHRSDFEIRLADGSVDRTRYEVVDAMISALDIGALAFNDGLYFDASSVDAVLLKDAFKQVFYVLNQMQHYKMMMQEN